MNFRDLGGLPTVDGRLFREGVVFRSGRLSSITPRDAAKLEALGIRLICDLRAPRESARRPPRGSSIRVVNISLHDPETQEHGRLEMLRFLLDRDRGERFRRFIHGYYRHLAFERASHVGRVVSLLAEDGNLPALVQCSAGKDRTGWIAAVIQLLAGVRYEHVQADYVETNAAYAGQVAKLLRITGLFGVPAERVRLLVGAHPELIDEAHRAMIEAHGSVGGYLREACGLAQETLDRLRSKLLA